MQQLDKAMLDFGMPMRSCELIDEEGMDDTYKVDKVCEEAYGKRMESPPLLQKLYDAKLLGVKSGKGFYIHKGKSKSPNSEAENIIKRTFHAYIAYSRPSKKQQNFLQRVGKF